MPPETTGVYLSIGSNIERERHILQGCALLRRQFGALRLSRVYETPAVGFAGGHFLNLAAGFVTGMELRELAACLRRIEVACGRDREQPKFSPRTLDLDLLLYGDLVVDLPGLSLPRAEILEYDFVLGPLAEIAPDLVHPVVGRRLADLWSELPKRIPMVAVGLEP